MTRISYVIGAAIVGWSITGVYSPRIYAWTLGLLLILGTWARRTAPTARTNRNERRTMGGR